MKNKPIAATAIPLPPVKTLYPPPFDTQVKDRRKRKLGDFFGLNNFGVNLTELGPGAVSALLHHHSKQDEFIYVLAGNPTLVLGEEEYLLQAGECMGFKAGCGVPSQLVNRSAEPAVFLEIGDRSEGDEVEYPNDDLKATQLPNGVWRFTRKDGSPF